MQRTSQGQHPARDRFLIVPRTLSFIFYKDQLFLLKGAPTKQLWPNLFNGIGGHIQQGEDVSTAALREIFEETGLTVNHLQLEGVIIVDHDSDLGICLYVFTAQADTQALTPSSEGNLFWFNKQNLPDNELVEDIPVLLERIYSKKSGDAPFSARYHFFNHDRLTISFFREIDGF